MKANPLINNFNTGEVSELVESRSDLAKYAAACKTLQNAMPLVEGGAKKMPGTMFAGIAANGGPLGTVSTGKSRLVPFQFSTNQNAVLEFYAGGIRFWINNGLVLAVGGLSDWMPTTSYNVGDLVLFGNYTSFDYPGGTQLIVQYPYAEPNDGGFIGGLGTGSPNLSVIKGGTSPNQYVQINLANANPARNSSANITSGIQALGYLNSPVNNYVGLTSWQAYWLPVNVTPELGAPTAINYHPVGAVYKCLTANTGQFPPTSADWELTDGTEPLIVTTPYAEADLFQLDVSTQSADVLYIAHTSYPPATLNRYSDSNWTYTPISGPTATTAPGPSQLYGTQNVIKTGYSALGQSISLISQSSSCVIVLATTPAAQPFNNGDRIYINECAGMVELNQGQFLVSGIGYGTVTVTVIDNTGAVSTITATGWSLTLLDPDSNQPVNSSAYLQYQGGGFAVGIPALFTGAGNYPACATLYQQRLVLAGTLNNPTQMSGSVQDDYPDFIADPNEEDYAIQFTLVSQQVNPIRWMIGSPTALLLGTSGGVFSMYTVDGNPLSQTDVTAALQTTIGTGNVAPQLVNADVLWITRTGLVVRLFIYSFLTNQWEGPDLTRLNRQITIGPTQATSGIVQTAFQKELYPIFWAVRADGQLLGMTYERQEEVFAWFRVVTDGIIESVAVVSQDGAEDQVWIVVNRTVNGVSQRYVEYFTPQEIFGQLSNAFFVHCGLQLNMGSSATITAITQASPTAVTSPGHGFTTGASVQIAGVEGMTEINQGPASAYTITVVDANTYTLNGMNSTAFSAYTGGGVGTPVTNACTGLQYLQGKTVQAVGDGAIIFTGAVPSTGALSFPYYVNLLTVGLPITTIIEPMNPIIGSQQQTSRGKKQKFNRATFSLYQSIGGQYGTDQQHLYDMAYGPGATGLQPELFTGSITRDLDGEWQDEDTISIVHTDPFPFCLRSVVPRLSTADEG